MAFKYSKCIKIVRLWLYIAQSKFSSIYTAKEDQPFTTGKQTLIKEAKSGLHNDGDLDVQIYLKTDFLSDVDGLKAQKLGIIYNEAL